MCWWWQSYICYASIIKRFKNSVYRWKSMDQQRFHSLATVFYFSIIHRQVNWFELRIDHISGIFIVFEISLHTENFDTICNLVKRYGEFLRIWIGPQLNVLVSDPNDVEVNSIHKIQSFTNRNLIKLYLSKF